MRHAIALILGDPRARRLGHLLGSIAASIAADELLVE